MAEVCWGLDEAIGGLVSTAVEGAGAAIRAAVSALEAWSRGFPGQGQGLGPTAVGYRRGYEVGLYLGEQVGLGDLIDAVATGWPLEAGAPASPAVRWALADATAPGCNIDIEGDRAFGLGIAAALRDLLDSVAQDVDRGVSEEESSAGAS